MPSAQDKFANASAKLTRKWFDHNIKMLGKQVSVTRFSVQKDFYDDEGPRVPIRKDEITIVITYPHGEIPLTRFRSGSSQVVSTGVFLMDIIPIDVLTQFAEKVEKGDYIFHIIKDEIGNKFGILLQLSEALGAVSTELVWKKHLASVYNGEVDPVIEQEIQKLLK